MISRVLRILAAAADAVADEIEETDHEVTPEPFVPGDQTRKARTLATEMRVRRVLSVALRRDSQETPQA